jgi:hypothetical protein
VAEAGGKRTLAAVTADEANDEIDNAESAETPYRKRELSCGFAAPLYSRIAVTREVHH